MPGMSALVVILLGAAAGSGIDQMANVYIVAAGPVTVSGAAADGPPTLRHLVLRGLERGSLPGGLPYDEPREDRYDENYTETLHEPPAHA